MTKAKQSGKIDVSAPGEFDLTAFVNDALSTYAIKTVTNHPGTTMKVSDLLDRRAALVEAQRKLQARSESEEATDKDRRLAQKAATSPELAEQLKELDDEVKELYGSLDGVWVQVRVDTPDVRTKQEVRRSINDYKAELEVDELLPIDHCTRHLVKAGRVRRGHDGDGQKDDAGWTSLADVDAWELFLNAIGPSQAELIDAAVAEAFYAERGVTPDFFMRLSAFRAMGASAKS